MKKSKFVLILSLVCLFITACPEPVKPIRGLSCDDAKRRYLDCRNNCVSRTHDVMKEIGGINTPMPVQNTEDYCIHGNRPSFPEDIIFIEYKGECGKAKVSLDSIENCSIEY